MSSVIARPQWCRTSGSDMSRFIMFNSDWNWTNYICATSFWGILKNSYLINNINHYPRLRWILRKCYKKYFSHFFFCETVMLAQVLISSLQGHIENVLLRVVVQCRSCSKVKSELFTLSKWILKETNLIMLEFTVLWFMMMLKMYIHEGVRINGITNHCNYILYIISQIYS